MDNIIVIEDVFQVFSQYLIIGRLDDSYSSSFESFLKTETTFAVLSMDGKTPVTKERLNKSASCMEISFLRNNKTLIINGNQNHNHFGYLDMSAYQQRIRCYLFLLN